MAQTAPGIPTIHRMHRLLCCRCDVYATGANGGAGAVHLFHGEELHRRQEKERRGQGQRAGSRGRDPERRAESELGVHRSGNDDDECGCGLNECLWVNEGQYGMLYA